MPPRPPTGPRTNRAIRVPEVRLIDEDGAQLGVVPIAQALEMARGQIDRIVRSLQDIAVVEQGPMMEGRAMFAILARSRAATAAAATAATAAAAARSRPADGQAAPAPADAEPTPSS